jgi:hypothetical protein
MAGSIEARIPSGRGQAFLSARFSGIPRSHESAHFLHIGAI